jgi:hypothetical protein
MARMKFSEAVGRLSTPSSQRKPIPYDPFDGRKFKFVTIDYKDSSRIEFKPRLSGPQIPLRYQVITGKASQMSKQSPDFTWRGVKQDPEFWVKARAKWEATPRTHRNNNENAFITQLKKQAKATQAPARKPVSKVERSQKKAQRDKVADKKKVQQEKAAKTEAAKFNDMKITFLNNAKPEEGFAVRDRNGKILESFKEYGDAKAWADAKKAGAKASKRVEEYLEVKHQEFLKDQVAEEVAPPVEAASMIGIAAPSLTREESERVRERIPEKMGRDEAARKAGLDPVADRDTIGIFEDVMWGARPRTDIPFGMNRAFGSYRSNRQEAQQPLSGSY